MSQQTIEGPTQTAVEGASKEWTPRPFVAVSTRLAIIVFPYVVGFGVALLISMWWPASRFDVHPLLWWVGVAIVSTLAMIPADRLVRRFMPLTSLLMVALAFPDAAPSRFGAAMRSRTTAQVSRRVDKAVASSSKGEFVDRSQYMLDLVSMLTTHDRMTRGHSERVRAYSSLIGEELRLSKSDQQKLYWAALLHDVGKLDVPAKILNKRGRPSKAEWALLQTHPAAAVTYLEPLQGWLGTWSRAADEHHLRWDGKGYPTDVGGTDISLAGRLVGVADAYDVMTSARSYKSGLSPADPRVELSKSAGHQFDPHVVRTFLNIGLKRLRLAGGPLASLPFLVSSLLNGLATNGGKVLLATTAVTSGAAVSPPVEPPLVPAILAYAEDASQWFRLSEATPTLTLLPPSPELTLAEPEEAVPEPEAPRDPGKSGLTTPPVEPAAAGDVPAGPTSEDPAPPPVEPPVVPAEPVAPIPPAGDADDDDDEDGGNNGNRNGADNGNRNGANNGNHPDKDNHPDTHDHGDGRQD